jgi:hypothetical protein
MGSVEVVIVGKLDKRHAQVPLADDDQVIQALLADRSNQAFGDRVRSWRSDRGSDAGDAQT